MPRTRIGLVLALLLAPVPSTAARQSDKDLAQQIFDVMVQLPGNTRGYRLIHAKGIVCQGTFAATQEAAKLSQAEHFRGATEPVTVRFSEHRLTLPFQTSLRMPLHAEWRFDLSSRAARNPSQILAL